MKKGTLVVLSSIVGALSAVASCYGIMDNKLKKSEKKVDKFKNNYNMLIQWLALIQNNKSLEAYFIKNNYRSIAIYGMGEIGNRLYEELINTNIEIKYAVDKNAESVYTELKLLSLEDDFDDVDVIIVTAAFAFEEIKKDIGDKVDFPIVSIEDVVYDI